MMRVMKEVDPGELERLASALRLAESALEEALEAAETLGNFDRLFDVPRAVGGAQRLVGNALEAVDAARNPWRRREGAPSRAVCCRAWLDRDRARELDIELLRCVSRVPVLRMRA